MSYILKLSTKSMKILRTVKRTSPKLYFGLLIMSRIIFLLLKIKELYGFSLTFLMLNIF